MEVAPQRERGALVGAGRAAETEVDAPRVQRVEGADCSAMTSGAWFGSMIPPAPTRIVDVPASNVADHHRGRRARDAGHVVVLRHPVTAIPQRLGPAREVEGVAHRLRGAPAFGDG